MIYNYFTSYPSKLMLKQHNETNRFLCLQFEQKKVVLYLRLSKPPAPAAANIESQDFWGFLARPYFTRVGRTIDTTSLSHRGPHA